MPFRKDAIVVSTSPVNQARKPSGWLGRMMLRNMNSRHSGVTDWGLTHVSVRSTDTVLDVGCGGGKTIGKLAAMASDGKVYGVDFSADSVKVASKTNRGAIESGKVEIREGSVSELPFGNDIFDVVTAVETHFWWPDLPGDLREVRRVMKPGATLVIIAEVFKGANTNTARLVERYLPKTGMKFLTPDEHRQLLEGAGYHDIQISVNAGEGWICCVARG